MSGVPPYMPKAKVYCDFFFKAIGVHNATGCKGHVPSFLFFFETPLPASIRTYVGDNMISVL